MCMCAYKAPEVDACTKRLTKFKSFVIIKTLGPQIFFLIAILVSNETCIIVEKFSLKNNVTYLHFLKTKINKSLKKTLKNLTIFKYYS